METTKREAFLEVFLGALGARQIHWSTRSASAVSGTVVYDPTAPDERQDFIWHMTEEETPSQQLAELIHYLAEHQLLDGDKLKVSTTEVQVPGMDDAIKEQLFEELFQVGVNMMDEGEETDTYFIHD